jgi:hypothetical protein
MAFDPQIAAQWSQRLQQDPIVAALLRLRQTNPAGQAAYDPQTQALMTRIFGAQDWSDPRMRANAATTALGRYTTSLGLPEGYTFGDMKGGQIDPTVHETKGTPGWAQAAMYGTLGLAAAPFAMNALGVGAAPGGAGAAVGPEGVAETIGSSGGVPQILGGAGAGASKAGSIFGGLGGGGLIPNLINIGSRVGGALLGSHAAGKAAQQQERSIQSALDLQKDLYGQSKAALMPYYQLGAGSLGRLGSFLGTSAAPPIPDGTLRTLGGK